jgi:hypothetical protein
LTKEGFVMNAVKESRLVSLRLGIKPGIYAKGSPEYNAVMGDRADGPAYILTGLENPPSLRLSGEGSETPPVKQRTNPAAKPGKHRRNRRR